MTKLTPNEIQAGRDHQTFIRKLPLKLTIEAVDKYITEKAVLSYNSTT